MKRTNALRPSLVSLTMASLLSLMIMNSGDLRADDFRRGDVNTDGNIDISDSISLLVHLSGEESLSCDDAADCNDDGAINVGDVIYGLAYLFVPSTPDFPAPSSCGSDPTSDALSCVSFSSCP
ncbi:MAG: hypothetical protein AAF488_18455 [Planctomycetota bacterium]